MRNNQERVTEIFRRAATYQTTTPSRTKNQWTQPWVKILVSMLVVVVLFSSGLGLLLALSNRNHIHNLDQMYIANFAKYKAIGAGSINATAEQVLQTQSLNATSNNTNEKMYLFGIDNDNNVERCYASNEKNNHTTYAINDPIESIYAFTHYTIVTFKPTNESSSSSILSSPYYRYQYSYLIDNSTGKFYSLSAFGDTEVSFGYATYYDIRESQDSIFADVYYYQGADRVRYIYQIYVTNERLILQEIFDFSLNLDVDQYFVDRYNHVYLCDYNTWTVDSYTVKYIINDGQLVKPSDIGATSISRSLNGICYSGTKYINHNGQLVDTSFNDYAYYFNKEDKIKSTDNVDYYLITGKYGSIGTNFGLYRVTWQNDIEFATEKIEYSRSINPKGFAITQDYIYVIEENTVSRIEITTGNVTPLNSDYTFTSIQTDYLGNIVFNGNDNAMNKITGIITNDGNVSILTTPRKYQIFYIAPIN